MHSKNKRFLAFVSMGAVALAALTMAGEGGLRFKADLVEDKRCVCIFFGLNRYSSTGHLDAGDYAVSSSSGFAVSLDSMSSCYSGGAGNAARIGSSDAAGSFTMSFGDCVISQAKITGYSFNVSYPGAGTIETYSGSTQIGSGSFSVSSGDSISGVTASNETDDPSVAIVHNLDGGSRASCNKLTFSSVMDGASPSHCDQISLVKIVLTVLTPQTETTSSVQSKALSALALSGEPTTTNYNSGSSFDPMGVTVTATYSDGSSADVTSEVVWTPDPLTSGTTAVTGTYSYFSVSKTVTCSGLTVVDSGNELKVIFNEMVGNQYGDGIYLKYGDWDCCIDGGTSSDKTNMVNLLKTYCTDKKLDLYVVTHSHNDHAGVFTGATKTSNVFVDAGITSFGYIVDCGSYRSVSTFWQPYCDSVRDAYMVSDCGGTYIPVHSLFNNDPDYASYQGDAFLNVSGENGLNDMPATLSSSASGNVFLEFLNTNCYLTPGAVTDTDPNRTSVACMLSAWNERYIFSGDGTGNTQNGIMANYSDQYGHSTLWDDSDDVYLKANHHCSNTDGSNSQEWIDWVNPDHVLISTAVTSPNASSNSGISQDHPDAVALARFLSATYDVHWNGVNGTMSYTTSSDGATVSFAGTAKQVPYYVGSTQISGEETTTLPMSQWCQSGDSYCHDCARDSATGHD
ncbi:MAG: hypothetical protein LKG11_03075 [Bacilli bacterium]|jgi:beta-lactamase superfamily II metal-dependent hydrolase|nr:hypothetical protein [Bacilli bacterium]